MAQKPLSPLLDGELVIALRRHCALTGLKIRGVVEDAIAKALDQEVVPEKKPSPARRDEVLQIGVNIDEPLFRRMKVFCVEHRITIRAFLDAALRRELGSQVDFDPGRKAPG